MKNQNQDTSFGNVLNRDFSKSLGKEAQLVTAMIEALTLKPRHTADLTQILYGFDNVYARRRVLKVIERARHRGHVITKAAKHLPWVVVP